MKKIIYKGIFGVFIFVFAFLTVSTLTMENVYAKYDKEECKKLKKNLKNKGTLLARYGITITYKEDSDTYTVTMKGETTNDVFKLTKLRFYDLSEIDDETASALDEDEYGEGAVADDEGTIIKTNSMIFGGKSYEGSNIISLYNDGIIKPKIDVAIYEAIALAKGMPISINRKDLYSYANDTRMGLALTFEPVDITKLKTNPFPDGVCGKNANFKITVGLALEKYDDMDSSVYDSGIDTSNTKFAGINCENYANKFKEDSFEYKFCNDLDNATKAGVVNTNGKTKTGENGKKLTYTSKYTPYDPTNVDTMINTSYKCKKEDIVGAADISTMKDYYVNKNYLYGESSETIEVGTYVYHIDGTDANKQTEKVTCEKKCREVVTVEYGPPVAQKGGFCFEYKVKVTSRVDCSGELSKKEPKKYAVCTPTPTCEHNGDKIYLQGGPSEEFDKCVVSCDGGKYTDKCANKCYKQVYGKSVKKTNGFESIYVSQLNNNSTAVLEEVENGNDSYLKELKGYIESLKKNIKNGGNVEAAKKELEELEKNYTYTCTNKNCGSKNINWNVYNTNRYRYPNGFNDPVTVERGGSKSVGTDAYWHQKNKWGLSTSRYTLYTSSGIPKTAVCKDYCYWKPNKKGVCGDDSYAHYINDPEVYDSAVRKYLGLSGSTTAKSLKSDQAANKKVYDEAKDKCQAVASCSTTSAEFAISVRYKDNKNQDVWSYFPYTPNNDKNTKATIEPGKYPAITCSQTKKDPKSKICSKGERSSILLDYAGCYNCAGSSTTKMYMTEWSFPGYYEDIKYGNREYNPRYGCDTSYTYVANKWCIPGKDKMQDANQYWYNYYQDKAHKGDTSYSYNNKDYVNKIDDCKTSSKTYSDKVYWNIFANTKNFGYMNWEIGMTCFYATNSEYKSSTTGKVCTPSKKEGNGVKTRTVDLTNMFPDESGKKPTSASETVDTPGFNWTGYAIQSNKNLDKDGKYTQFALESNPPALIKWIQSQGSAIYDSNKNLDYAVTLTKNDINEIRKQLNGKDKYTEWPGNVEKGDVYNYMSPLLRGGKTYTISNAIYPNAVALKCNNIAEHTAGADYAANCQSFTEEGK